MASSKKVLIFGGIIMDRYIVVDQYPVAGQDAFINEEFEMVGGSAINVAITLKNLGCHPSLISVVGSDAYGDKIIDYLTYKNLDISNVHQMPAAKTGYCYTVLDESKERTFFSSRGSENSFFPSMMNEELFEVPVAYVTGYNLLEPSSSPLIIETLTELNNRGCIILFDPSPIVDSIDKDILFQVLSISKIITPNADEEAKMVKVLSINEEFSDWCLNLGIELVITKSGSSGSKMITKTNIQHLKGYKMQTIDTSGAGDSFAGGLIAGIINSYDYKESVKIANACGAITTTFKGPHGKFSWKDIQSIIE